MRSIVGGCGDDPKGGLISILFSADAVLGACTCSTHSYIARLINQRSQTKTWSCPALVSCQYEFEVALGRIWFPLPVHTHCVHLEGGMSQVERKNRKMPSFLLLFILLIIATCYLLPATFSKSFCILFPGECGVLVKVRSAVCLYRQQGAPRLHSSQCAVHPKLTTLSEPHNLFSFHLISVSLSIGAPVSPHNFFV